MDHNQHSPDDSSQYPDPEHSGLSFPWLDQYQPVAADGLSTRLQPIVYEGYIPEDNLPEGDGFSGTQGYGLRNRWRKSTVLVEDDLPGPSAILEDSDEDPEFEESDIEAE
jgi:hypothetical protein